MIYLGLLLIILLGYLITSLLIKNESIIEKLFLGILISSGIYTFIIFLSGLFGMSFNLINSLFILAFLILGFLVLNVACKTIVPSFVLPKINDKKFLVGILIIGATLVVSSLMSNLYWPVRDWDALTLYDFRGKYFALNTDLLSVFEIHRYYLGYPLYTSIIHGLVYLTGAGNPKFIYTILYLSLIVLSYHTLTRLVIKKVALTSSLLIAFIPEIFNHSMIAYTNLPYVIFVVLGYMYLLNYLKLNKINFLIISGALIGLSTWIRSSDPFWLAPILLTCYYGFKNKKYWHLLLFVFIILSIKLPWTYFVGETSKNYMITSSNNVNLLFSSNLNRYVGQIFQVVPYIYNYVIKPQLVMLITFILSLFLFDKKNKEVVFQTSFLIIINLFIISGGIYVYSLIYEKWSVIGDSVSRMSMFLTPLVYLHSSIIIDNLKSKNFK